MVDFVEDEEAEAIAVAVHVHVGAVVGCDRQVIDFVISTAEDAHVEVKGIGE